MAEVTRIDLKDGLPTTVQIELTIDELVWIAKVTGKHSPLTSEETVPGYGPCSSSLYSAAVGQVFNRFWDNGVDGCIDGDDE